MTNPTLTVPTAPARTHAEATVLFRRPFAPGAIGFRAMTKVPYKGEPYAGAQVAAYIGAQSVVQRLNAVVPGRWHQQFHAIPGELAAARRGGCTSRAGSSSRSRSRPAGPTSTPCTRTSASSTLDRSRA